MRHLACVALSVVVFLPACPDEGCLSGEEGCTVPSPCAELTAPSCGGGTVEVRVLEPGDARPGGMDALSAPGDVLLGNDRVVAVVEGLDHPHYLGPTGGMLLDLGLRGGDNDSLPHVVQVTGLLPWESAAYTDLRVIEGDGFAAIQVTGTLAGRPDTLIATRYEVRPCEPGIRVRTEFALTEGQAQSIFLTDGWYWGGRSILPFTPSVGAGFVHRSFGLSTIEAAFEEVPFMVGAAHVDPAVSYVTVGCNTATMEGFHSATVSTAGLHRTLVQPGGTLVFERFIGVTEGGDVEPAAALGQEIIRQLRGGQTTTISGRVLMEGGGQPEPRIGATVVVSAGGAAEDVTLRVPWSQVTPAADGSWSVTVPTGDDYVVSIQSHGRTVLEHDVTVGTDPTAAGDLTIPAVARLHLDATVDGSAQPVLAFVLPADDDTLLDVAGSYYGRWDTCAPFLGPPHGGSPACNRVIVDGPTSVDLPPGNYEVFTTAGPFSTMKRVPVELSMGGEADVLLDLSSLAVTPIGTLSGDFHVHGATSFDSSVPDDDRVRAFLAARMEVIATTDHDASWDYAEAMDRMDANDRLHLMVGVETTGHILSRIREDGPPQVVGHWNFWPVPFDADSAWRGATWDELAEPGMIMTRMEGVGWDTETGVVQLNHPILPLEFGRDQGFASTLHLDANVPLPTEFDGTEASYFLRTPPGSTHGNGDYDTQEVMNGTDNGYLPDYRAFWWYLLNQGIPRAGVGNSDSHGLTDNVLGTPRSVVFTDQTLLAFDDDLFNAELKAGRVVGTNGPMIEASLRDAAGTVVAVPTVASSVSASAGLLLHVTVRAAPWVPVTELRIIVDGVEVQILPIEGGPADPLGMDVTPRLELDIPVADLLSGDADAWIVVEAGTAMPENADLNCDGFPDTGDTNGDGTIDWHDVTELTEDPEADCLDTVGPLGSPPLPEPDDPLYAFQAVVPRGWPFAFTNPFLLDVDGDGFWQGVR